MNWIKTSEVMPSVGDIIAVKILGLNGNPTYACGEVYEGMNGELFIEYFPEVAIRLKHEIEWKLIDARKL